MAIDKKVEQAGGNQDECEAFEYRDVLDKLRIADNKTDQRSGKKYPQAADTCIDHRDPNAGGMGLTPMTNIHELNS
jgi:hypothetical protein